MRDHSAGGIVHSVAKRAGTAASPALEANIQLRIAGGANAKFIEESLGNIFDYRM
jgi:hypothetical protein